MQKNPDFIGVIGTLHARITQARGALQPMLSLYANTPIDEHILSPKSVLNALDAVAALLDQADEASHALMGAHRASRLEPTS